MYSNIEELYIRKNLFSIRYIDNERKKEAHLMFDDDFDFSQFDFDNIEKFNYSNGYLQIKFDKEFLVVSVVEDQRELCKVYCPKKLVKQIRKDLEVMEYFSLRYRKHFIEKYRKEKRLWN